MNTMINEPKEMKKIAAKIRKALLAAKHDVIVVDFTKYAEISEWTRQQIERCGIESLVTDYGTLHVQCTKFHGVQTLRIDRDSFFDEDTVNQVTSQFPMIHRIADVVSSSGWKMGAVQMAYQYNRNTPAA